jgi:endonuclease I
VSLETYYAPAAGATGSALRAALHGIIKGHRRFSYTCVWTILEDADVDPVTPDHVIALYTGRSIPKSRRDQGQNDPDSWNREHVWPKSHGFPHRNQHAHTDAHHLRPTDRSVNTSRGNRDFDEGGAPHDECLACRLDADSWEPPDGVKGDTVRMLLYLAVRYEGEDGDTPDLELVNRTTSGDEPFLGHLCMLLHWHRQDPVSEAERWRHDRVYHWQGNRNPFIDHPEWVSAIWGDATACVRGAGGTPETPAAALPAIIGNRRSHVYHRRGCPGYDQVSEPNRVPFSSAAEAEAAGYRRAGNCP